MKRRNMLLALLVLALPLLACDGGEVVETVVDAGVRATEGAGLCARACSEVDLKLYKYRAGDDPACWCVKASGETVQLW